MKFCNDCGFEVPRAAVECSACGAQAMDEMEMSEVMTDPPPTAEGTTGADGGVDGSESEAAMTELDAMLPLDDVDGSTTPNAEDEEKSEDATRFGRYEVIRKLDVGEGTERFAVADDDSAELCWSCRSTANTRGQAFCDDCGARLSGKEFLLVKERRSQMLEEALDRYRTIDNANLPRVYDSFSDSEATYWTSDLEESDSQSDKPLGGFDLLAAMCGVVEGLSALNDRGLHLPHASADDFLIRSRRGQLRNLEHLQISPDVPEEGSEEEPTSDIDSRWRDTLLTVMSLAEPAEGMQPPIRDALVSPRLDLLRGEVSDGEISDPGSLLGHLRRLEARVRPANLLFDVAKATDIGQEKDQNEDACGGIDATATSEQSETTRTLLVVADGMGGHEAGEVASRMAVANLMDSMWAALGGSDVTPSDTEDLEEALIRSFVHAHRSIVEASSDGLEMGTTLVTAALVDNMAYIANVGDSRAYVFDGQHLTQVTEDHSLVALLASTGQITRDEMYTHPRRNEIMRVVGAGDDPEVDTFVARLQPGDTLLLCSDGLWEMVRDDEIAAVLTEKSSSFEAAQELVRRANVAGGVDNITAVVLRAIERETYDTYKPDQLDDVP